MGICSSKANREMVTTSRKRYHKVHDNKNSNDGKKYSKFLRSIKSKNKIENKSTTQSLSSQREHRYHRKHRIFKAIECEKRLELLVHGYCLQLFNSYFIETPIDLINIIFLYILEYFTCKHPVFVSINDNDLFEYKYIMSGVECEEDDVEDDGEDESDGKKIKVLILGAALTGKSTIIKQLRNLYGRSFDSSELFACRPHITQNVIKSMKKLAIYSKKLENRELNTTVESHNQIIRDRISMMSDKVKFTQKHYCDFMTLWNDEGIKETYKFRNEFHLCDNTMYWFNNMNRYYNESYIPTFKDILHARQRTTGVNKTKFLYNKDHHYYPFCYKVNNANNIYYDIYDVGGTRNERRRWINFFEWTDIVIFTVGLNGFCRLLWEDNKNNRLKEDIALFKRIINLDKFSNTKFYVLLNKLDVLIKDLKCYSFCEYFKEFGDQTDQTDIKNIIEFIVLKLLQQRNEKTRNRHNQNITFIATSAIDTDSIKCIFDFISNDCL